ncbi:MAG: DUF6365 family protein [Candidatus Sericytochromatia bacterium]
MSRSLLFIQISETDYDESFLVQRLISQISGECKSYILCNGLSSSLLMSNPEHVVGILTEDQDDNLRRFETIHTQVALDAIVILDVYKYFMHPLELNFLPVWLENLAVPIIALDYFNLLTYHGEQLGLHSGVNLQLFEKGEEPLALNLQPWLLKPVPPVIPEAEVPFRTLYWDPSDYSLIAAAPELRQQVRQSLQMQPETRVITLIFDISLYAQSLERNLLGYFFVAVEVLIFYLRQFQGQSFKLLVVGSTPPTDDLNPLPDLNVAPHYFSHLTEDNYRAFLAASDLIISHTQWSFLLFDAMMMGTPVCVLGNSVIQEWKDETEQERVLRSYFQPHPSLFKMAELMVSLNAMSVSLPIFEFLNYPLRLDINSEFPEPGLIPHAYAQYVLDMFDDETTLPILSNLLFSASERERHQALCQNLLKIREQGKTFDTILQHLEPAHVPET